MQRIMVDMPELLECLQYYTMCLARVKAQQETSACCLATGPCKHANPVTCELAPWHIHVESHQGYLVQ